MGRREDGSREMRRDRGTRVVVGKEERLMLFSTGNTAGKEKRPVVFYSLVFPFNERMVLATWLPRKYASGVLFFRYSR